MNQYIPPTGSPSVDVDGSPVNHCCTKCAKRPSPYEPKLPTIASIRIQENHFTSGSAFRSRHVPMANNNGRMPRYKDGDQMRSSAPAADSQR